MNQGPKRISRELYRPQRALLSATKAPNSEMSKQRGWICRFEMAFCNGRMAG